MDSTNFHNQVRVFLPSGCLQNLTTGILIGLRQRKEDSSTFFYIIGTISSSLDHEHISLQLQSLSKYKPSLEIIGLVQNTSNRKQHIFASGDFGLKQLTGLCLHMEIIENELPICYVRDTKKSTEIKPEDLMIILYHCCDVSGSIFVTEYAEKNHEKNVNLSDISKPLDVISLISLRLNRNVHIARGLFHNHCRYGLTSNVIHKLFVAAENAFVKISGFVGGVLSKTTSLLRIADSSSLQTLKPLSIQQLHIRSIQLQSGSNMYLSKDGTSQKRQHFRDIFTLHMFDVLLGLILLRWFLISGRTELISEGVIVWAEYVVTKLQALLLWMNGAPGGLKLNKQLTELLGKFFTYHIYLWSGYLNIMGPFLHILIYMMAMSGLFGISTQLAVGYDLITMMTLHIYCFYIYASKLYNLQVYALTALWRLFRGKKWNVIRQRVDSASFDVDQLFIGTLLFTALLFLLPTVGIYYIVFTGLRLAIILVQGTLKRIITVINMIPVASLVCWVVFPKFMSDHCRFSVIQRCNPPQYLMMQMKTASISKILTLLYCDQQHHRESWSTLFKKLCVGEIIYPWVEQRKTKKD